MNERKTYEIRYDRHYDPEGGFWVWVREGRARLGLTPLHQESTGAVVSLMFEAVGTELKRGEPFGSMEAEKHVGPLKTPLSGRICALNQEVLTNPRLVTLSPYEEGWLVELELTHFTAEKEHLLHGRDSIVQWFEAEINKFQDKGWLAEP